MLRLTWVLFLSILFHFVTFETIWFLPTPSRLQSSRDPIHVELVESEKPSKRKPDLPFDQPSIKNSVEQNLQDLKDKAQFLAEKSQRFNKQTRAALQGKFENAALSKGMTQLLKENKNYLDKIQKQENLNSAKLAENSDKSDITLNSKKDVPEFARAISQATSRVSTQPFDLPQEIEVGSATNLNADAHIYASFYNRIIEMFYVRWAHRLEALFAKLPESTKQQLSNRSWITELEIDLNEKGVYEKGFIMKNSGFKPFDDAGLFAFKDANYFPNPPKEKIESDGKIRLRYRIAVNVR